MEVSRVEQGELNANPKTCEKQHGVFQLYVWRNEHPRLREGRGDNKKKAKTKKR